MFVCLFVLLKGLKQMGRRMQIFVTIEIDLCFQLRFSHIFFSDFLKGAGLSQYTILGSHSFLLHLNSQRPEKAEDLFLLYDLLCPWGKGSAEQSKGVMATAQVLSGACGFPKPAYRNIFLGNIWNMVEVWKRGEPLGFCFARC